MRPEEIGSAQRIKQDILNKYQNVPTVETIEEIFVSDLQPAVDNFEIKETQAVSDNNTTQGKTPQKAKTEKEFADMLRKRLQDDESLGSNNMLTPENLKAFVKENIEDEKLKKEMLDEIEKLDGYADNKDEYLNLVGKNNKVEKMSCEQLLANVYAKPEMEKAFVALMNYWDNNESSNFTAKLNGFAESDEVKNNGISAKYQEYAINEYKKFVLPAQMEATLLNTLVEMGNEEAVKGLKNPEAMLQQAANYKKMRKDNGETDEVFEKFVKDKDYKGIAELAARHNAVMTKREELKSVKREDLEKALSKNTFKAIQGYLETHKNNDDTYDISSLSETIEYRSGKDYILNATTDDNRRELSLLKDDLNRSMDLGKNPDKVLKELARFCEFEVQGRDHSPRLLKAITQTAEGAVIGGATHCIAPNVSRIILNNTTTLHNTVNVTINGVHYTDIHTVLENIQHIEFNIPMCYGLLQAIGTGAATGAAISLLEDLVIGHDICVEQTCFNTDDFDRTKEPYITREHYIEYLRNKADKNQYRIAEPVLRKYQTYENGKKVDGRDWDCDGFFNEMREIAGVGSNLNCGERTGNTMYSAKKDDVVQPQQEPAIAEKHWHVDEKREIRTIEIDESNPANSNEKVIFNKKAKNSSWKHLVNNLYNCNDDGTTLVGEFGERKAIRILKIAQAITDGDYSKERLENLYELSLKGASKLKNIPGVDYGTYYSVLMGNMPSSVKLPTNLAGFERCEVTEDERILVAPGATNTNDAPEAAKGPAIGKGRKEVEVVTQEAWDADLYGHRDVNGKVHEFDTREERDKVTKEEEEKTGKKAKDYGNRWEQMTGEEPED